MATNNNIIRFPTRLEIIPKMWIEHRAPIGTIEFITEISKSPTGPPWSGLVSLVNNFPFGAEKPIDIPVVIAKMFKTVTTLH